MPTHDKRVIEFRRQFRYIAMDPDGRWFVYSSKPQAEQYGWVGDNPCEMDTSLYFSGNWKDSLYKFTNIEFEKVK